MLFSYLNPVDIIISGYSYNRKSPAMHEALAPALREKKTHLIPLGNKMSYFISLNKFSPDC